MPGARAIAALDFRVGGSVERPTRAYVTVDDAGAVVLHRTESRMNLLTRQLTSSVSRVELPQVPGLGPVTGVLLTQLADEVYLAERNGSLHRFDVRIRRDRSSRRPSTSCPGAPSSPASPS
jgi:phosphate transport system permease protein